MVQVVNEVEVGEIHTCGGTRIASLYFICTYNYIVDLLSAAERACFVS